MCMDPIPLDQSWYGKKYVKPQKNTYKGSNEKINYRKKESGTYYSPFRDHCVFLCLLIISITKLTKKSRMTAALTMPNILRYSESIINPNKTLNANDI